MNDYLEPANKIWQIACCVVSGIAAVTFLFGSTVLWMSMIREWQFTFQGKPLWIGAVITSIVGVASAFIALRLARRGTANGVTTLPAWFIQSFGVIFLVGAGFVAYDKKDLLFAVEGGSIGVAMILVNLGIARRQKKRRKEEGML